jgi:hypothetical protein
MLEKLSGSADSRAAEDALSVRLMEILRKEIASKGGILLLRQPVAHRVRAYEIRSDIDDRSLAVAADYLIKANKNGEEIYVKHIKQPLMQVNIAKLK